MTFRDAVKTNLKPIWNPRFQKLSLTRIGSGDYHHGFHQNLSQWCHVILISSRKFTI